MNLSIPVESQLLATKFFVPMASGTLISRPRLTTLLNESLEYPLTLVSAAAGFGKTTLLTTWSKSLPASNPRVAWVSLDEEDNEPGLFWAYVLTALGRQEPKRFTPLLTQLQSPQPPPLKYLLVALINLLMESTEHFLLILDDYHVITEQEVHSSLSYLIEHLPPRLRIILATRTDPPLPLSLLRVRGQALEVRTDQLRCTPEETKAFFNEVMGIQLPAETIQKIATRIEGWLVGLQLLGLSQPERTAPLNLLEQVSGDQRYILDYLTQEVLGRQPQEVQTFLLSTCILERLTASLCDAVLQQSDSQQMLHQLEKANLFVVSLDSKRQWYRYHALFAEALHYQLERMQGDLVPTLHHRASLWYAKHDQPAKAIIHAFSAHEWQWAADLIERKSLSLLSHVWGASEHELILFQNWLEQLPIEVVHSRPRLCMACSNLLWQVVPHSKLDAWFDAAEAALVASLRIQTPEEVPHPVLASEEQRKQENSLGEVDAFRAILRGSEENGQAALVLCQRALTRLSAENFVLRSYVAWAQLRAYYTSSANDAQTAIEYGLQSVSLAQKAEQSGQSIAFAGSTAQYMIGTGQLREAYHLTEQAIRWGKTPGSLVLPVVGWPIAFQADILREWNQLETALSLAEEALSLCQQTQLIGTQAYELFGYAILLRINLSCRDLDAARSAFEKFEYICRGMNQPISFFYRSFHTTVDQVKLWLANGELNRAMQWAEELDQGERCGTPFGHEREEVARARILLATAQPTLALQQLEPALKRATMGKRWGNVIEIQLLQALAYQMCQQETQALDTLAEAVQLAEPGGYIRSFVDEGAQMEALLYHLRKRDRKQGPTPYLDTLLAAFQQESMTDASAEEANNAQLLPDHLSDRERQVMQLLAHGASNLEIAQDLVIVIDTVKRHVSHIFSKLGVKNRVQAVRQARELGLLDDEH